MILLNDMISIYLLYQGINYYSTGVNTQSYSLHPHLDASTKVKILPKSAEAAQKVRASFYVRDLTPERDFAYVQFQTSRDQDNANLSQNPRDYFFRYRTIERFQVSISPIKSVVFPKILKLRVLIDVQQYL